MPSTSCEGEPCVESRSWTRTARLLESCPSVISRRRATHARSWVRSAQRPRRDRLDLGCFEPSSRASNWSHDENTTSYDRLACGDMGLSHASGSRTTRTRKVSEVRDEVGTENEGIE